ncbi:MAG: bifunctional precorrin-2 dehydrogenase/sirohydrochlorin ferrochelatase [Armatimonadetes bacterium]|nr:bifunctional precorrin-2 dehydrogenase/sirohydrochlorin ferrochelatase [Armatimonadota bacterium]
MKDYYQIALDVEGKPCLVVGGGEEAVEKTERLLEAGAAVTVVSPEVAPQLAAREQEGRIAVRRRPFRPEDVEGVFLVQNCVKGDPDLSAGLYALSRERRFLVGAWDQPQFSTYTMPALVRRGRLRLAISTGAASPGLSGILRRDLERLFDDEFVSYLDWLAERRREIEAAEPDRGRRAARNRENTRGFRLEGEITYPETYVRKQRSGG